MSDSQRLYVYPLSDNARLIGVAEYQLLQSPPAIQNQPAQH